MAVGDMVALTIDGRGVEVPKGTLVVEAAKVAGIEIPIFCYHPKLKPVGACRMCLVEIEKMPRLQTACTSPVGEGMVVHTTSPGAHAAQQGVLELLLANHPLDCPICDKGGECPLQDNTFKFGLGTSRYQEGKRKLDKALPLSDRIVLDRERCIMCYRCVRFQDEVAGDQALSAIDRAGTTQIGVLEGETFDSPFSGNTIDLCPVGALLSRQYRFRARPWDLQRTQSVCIGCGMGCNIELHARDRKLQRMIPKENMDINNEWLCDYGRFDTLPAGVERARNASVGGRETSWDEALRVAAEALQGASSLEIVTSPAITNEALAGLRALAPALGASLAVWPKTKTGRVRGTIDDLLQSKTIILNDFDVWQQLPVLALRIREALKRGARLYYVGSGSNGLHRDTTRSFGTVEEFLAATSVEIEPSSAASIAPSPAAAGEGRVRVPTPGGQTTVDLTAPISILGHDAGELGERLEATGLVGMPATAANGAAMADLPVAQLSAPVLLLIGEVDWPQAKGTAGEAHKEPPTVVSLQWSASMVPDSPTLGTKHSAPGTHIVLPIAHPYEQTGTITNFEGRVQELRAGGQAPPEARADWQAVADLAAALGLQPTPTREADAVVA